MLARQSVKTNVVGQHESCETKIAASSSGNQDAVVARNRWVPGIVDKKQAQRNHCHQSCRNVERILPLRRRRQPETAEKCQGVINPISRPNPVKIKRKFTTRITA